MAVTAVSNSLTDFPEIISVLLKCLPRPRLGVLHVPLVIRGLENTRDLMKLI